MTSRWKLAMTALALLACGKPSGATAPGADAEYSLQQASDSIPLPMGKLVHVGNHFFQLGGVSSDSRCPKGVVCVWAGDATADIAIHPGCYKAGCKAPSYMLQLHTHLEPRSGGREVGYKVTLLALLPDPVAGVTTDKASYVAWVRIMPAA